MANAKLTAEQNLRLILEIEANRAFILLAYQSNPELLKLADPEIRRLFEPTAGDSAANGAPAGDVPQVHGDQIARRSRI